MNKGFIFLPLDGQDSFGPKKKTLIKNIDTIKIKDPIKIINRGITINLKIKETNQVIVLTIMIQILI